ALLKRKGRLKPNIALAVFRQILSAFSFAHRLGVVHGDLRPSHIMLTKFGSVKVLDFPMGPLLDSAELTYLKACDRRYLPPEQPSGEPGDARLDVYSLGVLLYEMIVGEVPFGTKSDGVQSETKTLVFSLSAAECPSWLHGFISRALARSPSERFQSVRAMMEELSVPVKLVDPSWPMRVGMGLRQAGERGRVGSHLSAVTLAGHLVSWRTMIAAAIADSCHRAYCLAGSFRPVTATRCRSGRILRMSRQCELYIRHRSLATVRLLLVAARSVMSPKRVLTLRFETGGKHYGALAILVVSLLLEPVFFSHTKMFWYPTRIGAHKWHDQLAPQAQGRPETTHAAGQSPLQVAEKSAVPKNTGRRRKVRKSSSQVIRRQVEEQPEYLEAAAVRRKRRAIESAASKEPPERLRFEQQGTYQPASTRKKNDSDSSRIQLDVKWEN
ncbi:MAG TPA: serine/threonine-protein kinase, partial [Terriglobales bacterium]|nr:serine/threonine-protein kinase [Terriglobales bacterium]